MSWGAIGAAAITTVGGYLANRHKNGNPVNTADPFGGQRQQYQAPLKTLMDGGSLPMFNKDAEGQMATLAGGGTAAPLFQQAQAMLQPGYDFQSSDPSYKFRLDQGTTNVERAMQKMGLGASGNAMGAIMDYGQGMASQEFSNEFQRKMGAATAAAGHDSQLFGEQNLLDQNTQQVFNNQYQRLAQLSGASLGSPGTAAQLQSQQQGGAMAALSKMAGGLFGGGGSGGLGGMIGGLFGGGGDSGGGSSETFTPSTDFSSQLMPTLYGGGEGSMPLQW